MLFRKKIEKSCAYCAHSARLDEELVLCTKKGIASIYGKCRKFSYDPCKRIPVKPKALDLNKYKEEDFSL